MQCPRCHTENRAGHRFCGECGLSFALACPSCGFPKESNVKFCGDCGAPLAAPRLTPETRFASPESYTPSHLAEKILRSKSALEGEWKQVTVLFTDVSGFTAISSPLDPEDVHEIMDQCFDVILGAVHRYEGTINQFLGDGVMALFGAPIAHEDHPHRALRAALAIQRNLEPLREDVRRAHDAAFRVRIDIGVPWLSRIPILGYLFGSVENKIEKTELLLLITPRTVGTALDAARITDQMRRVTPELEQSIRQAPRQPPPTPAPPPPPSPSQ